MVSREITKLLQQYSKGFGAVLVVEHWQSGKTTLVKQNFANKI